MDDDRMSEGGDVRRRRKPQAKGSKSDRGESDQREALTTGVTTSGGRPTIGAFLNDNSKLAFRSRIEHQRSRGHRLCCCLCLFVLFVAMEIELSDRGRVRWEEELVFFTVVSILLCYIVNSDN
ncbi:hypothetical protein LINGRAHAP2_LOCUS7637 [Linum grandiflorum]